MLGSVSEAEDFVQEAMLRLAATEETIDAPAAWMTTVATRLSIDVLRLARTRRETWSARWRKTRSCTPTGAARRERRGIRSSAPTASPARSSPWHASNAGAAGSRAGS